MQSILNWIADSQSLGLREKSFTRIMGNEIKGNKRIILSSLILMLVWVCKKIDPKLSSSWSEYKGIMPYYKIAEANAKCAGIGRLPTMTELRSAYQANVTQSWKKDGFYYFSSEIKSTDSGDFPKIFYIGNYNEDRINFPYEGLHIRCIRNCIFSISR